MDASKIPVFQGGLMRCCIQTLVEMAEEKTIVNVWDVFDCKYEPFGNRQIILDKDGFKWNKKTEKEDK